MRDHAADIRALRRQSNEAIAMRDAQYVASFMADDVVVNVAGGPALRGREANHRAFAEQMATPGFGGYKRTPEQILVDVATNTATERGTWTGLWRVKGRDQKQQGRYSATWRLEALGWVIAEETYL
jgi:ketosteroid isomerase-like protein